MKVPEQHRLKSGPIATTFSDGNNGAFRIPHPYISGYFLLCIASDALGWEHVSVTLQQTKRDKPVERCCTWKEMCIVKDLFWNKDEAVMQLHPPESDHVSTHPYCLHLWKPINAIIPLPLPIMVGYKGDNIQSFT